MKLRSAVSTLSGSSTISRALGISQYKIYQRHSSSKRDELVSFFQSSYFPEKSFISEVVGRIRNIPHEIDMTEGVVSRFCRNDVVSSEQDKYSQIIISSTQNVEVRYGEEGLSPSNEVKPKDLLKHKILLPARFYGILDIKNHVPFQIIPSDITNTIVMPLSEVEKVYPHEENIRRFSLNVILEMNHDDAVRMNLGLRMKIYNDQKKEHFFEEITSRVYPPTDSNKSSGTLMDFSAEDVDLDKSTAMHFHPGERSLHIITTNKRSGVTLNFCGVSENPDLRKDTSQFIEFPRNSYLVLNFPAYTHHKFHGDFVCLSVHPREGKNLINAVRSDKISGGFLEFATVFSSQDARNEGWSNKNSQDSINIDKNKNGRAL